MREGYKKTEVGVIPEDWSSKRLDEVIEEFIVPMRDKPKVFDGNIPWCRIDDIEGKYIHGSKEGNFVSENTIIEMNLKIFPQNSLICSCSASLGVYAINTRPLITNQTFIGLVTKEVISVNFLYYYMNTVKNRMKNIASGTTIPYISRQKFEGFKIIVPPLKEQGKIAEILSTADYQIDDTVNLIEKYRELKKGLMQKLLTEGIGHSEFKKTEVGEIPTCWEVNKLGEICEFRQGFQIPREKQITELKENYVRYLYITDFFSDNNKLFVRDSDKYYYVKKQDITIANTGNTCGKSFRGAQGVLSNNMFKIFNNKEIISNDYLWQYLNSEIYWRQLNKYFNTAGQPHVGHKNMSMLVIAIPSLEEQNIISKILMILDNTIEEYENKKQKLEKLKKGLMQQLLIGKIRVAK